MTGAQVVPPISTDGTGLALIALNSSQSRITVTAAFGPFTSRPTAAHIHGPASAGQNAPALFDLGSITVVKIGRNYYGSTNIRTFAVTPAQVQQMLTGLWYVDVHTAAKPSGEIRGQIRDLFPQTSQRPAFETSEPGAAGSGLWSVAANKPDIRQMLVQIEQQPWTIGREPMDKTLDLKSAAGIARDREEFSWLIRSAIEHHVILVTDRSEH
jgi:hypothetical protein